MINLIKEINFKEINFKEIDFSYNEEELKIENNNNKLKENVLKELISQKKENKLKFKELIKDLFKYNFCHPTLNMIYNAYLYAEKFENQRRKLRKRKGLINKNKFSLKCLYK